MSRGRGSFGALGTGGVGGGSIGGGSSTPDTGGPAGFAPTDGVQVNPRRGNGRFDAEGLPRTWTHYEHLCGKRIEIPLLQEALMFEIPPVVPFAFSTDIDGPFPIEAPHLSIWGEITATDYTPAPYLFAWLWAYDPLLKKHVRRKYQAGQRDELLTPDAAVVTISAWQYPPWGGKITCYHSDAATREVDVSLAATGHAPSV